MPKGILFFALSLSVADRVKFNNGNFNFSKWSEMLAELKLKLYSSLSHIHITHFWLLSKIKTFHFIILMKHQQTT
jgi:hypothetical protein